LKKGDLLDSTRLQRSS